MKHRVTLTVPNTPLEAVFHKPELVLDGGRVEDVELCACRMYLAWKGNFPDRKVILDVEGLPTETAALNKALFRRRHRSAA